MTVAMFEVSLLISGGVSSNRKNSGNVSSKHMSVMIFEVSICQW